MPVGYSGKIAMKPRTAVYTRAAWIFCFSLFLRIWLIDRYPALYGYDAYLYLLGLSGQYPLFTGLIKLFITWDLSLAAIRLLVACVSALACTVFFLFGKALLGNLTAPFVAALLMSIFPSFLIFSIVPYTESFFLFFFFLGLCCFEHERHSPKSHFIKTGIALGLSCLTRYEGCLMLPLIFAYIIRQRARQKALDLSGLLSLAMALFWAPCLLVIYGHFMMSDLASAQSTGIAMILKKAPALFGKMLHSVSTDVLPYIVSQNLMLSLWIFLFGSVLSLAGCMMAIVKENDHPLLYPIFIIMALAIQFLPLASSVWIYGKVIELRRIGIVPNVFLLLYLSYAQTWIAQKIRRQSSRIAVFVFLLIPLVFGSFQTARAIFTDYQKLYRSSYIEPCWVGKPGDAGLGMLTSVSDKVLKIYLSANRLIQYPIRELSGMGPDEMEQFVVRHQVKYIITERRDLRLFDLLLHPTKTVSFRKIAVVGGWLFVYRRDDL